MGNPTNTKLSDKKVQALKPKTKAYRLNDDNGLSCFVTPDRQAKEAQAKTAGANTFEAVAKVWFRQADDGGTKLVIEVAGLLGHSPILSTVVYTDLAAHAHDSVWAA